MKPDMKNAVLLAIYKEYNQNIPDFKLNIRPETLGVEKEIFFNIIDKLQNERFIDGAIIKRIEKGNQPIKVLLNKMVLTRRGIEFVENTLGIENTLTNGEKIKRIGKKVLEWGWEQGKDITAKTLAYLIQNIIDKNGE